MGDKEDRHVQLVAQALDELQEGSHLAFAQRGGRLVEDQHRRVIVKGADDFDDLLQTSAQLVYRDVQRHFDPQLGAQFLGFLGDHLLIHQHAPARLMAEADILRASQVANQVAF